MPEELAQPVVLDATVRSNFASSSSVGHLLRTLNEPATVPAVREELDQGVESGYEFLERALDRLGDGIPVLQTRPGTGPRSRLRDRLDAGEADALLAASARDGTIATDDLAARRVAPERDVPVTGSVGPLVLGVRRDVLDPDVADDWLATWREGRGYHAPIDRVADVLG